ncbi:NAD(P)H-flavin reductase [Candidatus Schneideria nysicola]|uniref:NAD(P)H-flavin reductase n=1 Tax=Candidatus Schneideria nysicola TaxID=1081631 RepID=UPI001CAA642F|nr:NAD(P)H-flavin reductase [Candidatus Schneideria nysicola]UAJ66301.1 NAD(P)H-flavin reductase [Candidatus Schneideria nysicola]
MSLITCQIFSIENITNIIYRVRLIPLSPIHFRAGQYIMIVINEKDKRPFSFASPPSENSYVELHIGPSRSCDFTIINYLYNNTSIQVETPLGEAWLRDDSNCPILLIAGGMGYSYIRSILLTVIKNQPQRKVLLYWGGKTPSLLYEIKELNRLTLQNPQITIFPIVEYPDNSWKGMKGTVLEALQNNKRRLDKYDIYIAGNIAMVKSIRNYLTLQYNARIDRIFSDAFSI